MKKLIIFLFFFFFLWINNSFAGYTLPKDLFYFSWKDYFFNFPSPNSEYTDIFYKDWSFYKRIDKKIEVLSYDSALNKYYFSVNEKWQRNYYYLEGDFSLNLFAKWFKPLDWYSCPFAFAYNWMLNCNYSHPDRYSYIYSTVWSSYLYYKSVDAKYTFLSYNTYDKKNISESQFFEPFVLDNVRQIWISSYFYNLSETDILFPYFDHKLNKIKVISHDFKYNCTKEHWSYDVTISKFRFSYNYNWNYTVIDSSNSNDIKQYFWTIKPYENWDCKVWIPPNNNWGKNWVWWSWSWWAASGWAGWWAWFAKWSFSWEHIDVRLWNSVDSNYLNCYEYNVPENFDKNFCSWDKKYLRAMRAWQKLIIWDKMKPWDNLDCFNLDDIKYDNEEEKIAFLKYYYKTKEYLDNNKNFIKNRVKWDVFYFLSPNRTLQCWYFSKSETNDSWNWNNWLGNNDKNQSRDYTNSLNSISWAITWIKSSIDKISEKEDKDYSKALDWVKWSLDKIQETQNKNWEWLNWALKWIKDSLDNMTDKQNEKSEKQNWLLDKILWWLNAWFESVSNSLKSIWDAIWNFFWGWNWSWSYWWVDVWWLWERWKNYGWQLSVDWWTMKSPVLVDWDDCQVFDWLTFVYYSNWSFTQNLRFDISWDNDFMWVVKYITNVVVWPLNNFLSIVRTFSPVYYDNQQVCLFGKIKTIEYQKYMKSTDFYWKMTFFDYLFIFWAWTFIVWMAWMFSIIPTYWRGWEYSRIENEQVKNTEFQKRK